MSEESLTVPEMLNRLALHRQEWLRMRYDAEINAKVGKAVGDDKMLAAAAEQLNARSRRWMCWMQR